MVLPNRSHPIPEVLVDNIGKGKNHRGHRLAAVTQSKRESASANLFPAEVTRRTVMCMSCAASITSASRRTSIKGSDFVIPSVRPS